MKLEGSYKLDVKKEVVWQALNDANILKKCIPGCDSFKKESDTVFKVSATNQIGPMNATFSGTVSVSNIKKNQSYTLSGVGQSSAGFANGNANVNKNDFDKQRDTENRGNQVLDGMSNWENSSSDGERFSQQSQSTNRDKSYKSFDTYLKRKSKRKVNKELGL